MKRMKLYEADDKMIDLISDNYSMLQGLSAFGIRLGFGDKTVSQICEEQGVDCYTFLTVVNFLINGYTPKQLDDRISVKTLLDYLRASHHFFLDFQLPSIRRKLEETLSRNDSLTMLILRLYDEYAHDIHLHMKYEEKTLFPYVEALIRGEQKNDYSVDIFSKHHSDTTGKFYELKNIIIKYLPNDGLANNQLTATLYDIYNNEEGLCNHTNVEEKLGKAGYTPKQIEGRSSGNWILMDYYDVIIHVFDKENRLFYDIERIWKDGRKVIDIKEL